MTMTPFSTVLVANRGEIALRVMRTACRLGYRTVAVYSDADANAAHVSFADSAVHVGGSRPAESYLNIPAIIAAARDSGADAVHPGYGFLAENSAFARACREAGLVFIGPSPEAIDAMGDKAGAKAIMQQAGVPCVPGYQGEDQSLDAMAREAAAIGYPVMIKAVAGGGGRGMRLVPELAAFPDALRSATSEAASAFGDGRVILERAIVAPRHIEIQVFGDRHGNAVHLGERDCSVQRRHQKLIEEAPSPAVSPELRARMGAVAVQAVKAICYEGAGTLEFLLDAAGDFYFMEMNTRLQVEHPVTEAITGLDLVEWQLRVAAGDPLPLKQDKIEFNGHAIEVRLCAEDAEQDFMPQSGLMSAWDIPDDVRVDHALRAGDVIPPFYDSMIAKVIAHGRSRDEARQQLAGALDRLVAFGVPTNQMFLSACLRNPGFSRGEATTAFIAQQAEALKRKQPPDDGLTALLLFVSDPSAAPWAPGRSLATLFPTAIRFRHDATVDAEVLRKRDGSYAVRIGDDEETFIVEHCDALQVRVRRDSRASHTLCYRRDANRLHWLCDGAVNAVTDLTRAAPEPVAGETGDGRVRAALAGRVVALLVKPGDRVEAGQIVVTLEAMKMEHVHKAGVGGKIASVFIAEGDQVAMKAVLIEIDGADIAAQ